jgi:hypothetical protein
VAAYSRWSPTDDPATLQTFVSVSARLNGNVFESNLCNALAVDSGNAVPVAGVRFSASLSAVASSNVYKSNGTSGRHDIVTTVEHFDIPYGFNSFDLQFAPLHDSDVRAVVDSSFDYWNPAHDPTDCADAFDDGLVVNGVARVGTNADTTMLCPADQ